MAHRRVDPSPGSTSSLRTANQQRVLDVLRGVTPVGPSADDTAFTQAELARATGLAPATVSNIVRELTGSSLVEADPGSGRRGSAVRLARGAGLVAGVDFGHSHVAVAVGDLTGHLLAEERRHLAAGHDHVKALGVAGSMLDAMVAAHGPVRHVGLGLPAPVTDDLVRSSSIFPGWEDVDTRTAAEQQFGLPVHVENDANLGALAEHRHGVGRGHDSSVFVKISSGVGAGIIIDNKLFHGAGGTAGEIGHLTLDDQGPLCRCGSRGCLEAYASTGTALEMMSGQLPEATIDDIVEEAMTGNVSALRVFEDAGLHLGWGLANVTNLLNPGVILVGGDMSHAGDLLLDSARLGLRRHVLSEAASTPVMVASLGDRASAIGALVLAIESTDLLPEAAS